ncbi:MAG: MOSC domain-containing protein [Erythrobacter sp.]|jgi:MOSC domain-containing protein YiiM|nr:MOSC domain-containing protein [Erythrobacter sp.]
MRTDPYQPNLRQVHLIPGELIDELDRKGYELNPGNLGENIVTRGLDLTAFGRDTLLRIGPRVVLSVTGLRNPCQQIEEFAPGLLEEVAPHTPRGRECRVGIMTVVLAGGIVRPGDNIEAERPEGLHVPLRIV